MAIYAHFIDDKDDKIIFRKSIQSVPRVGDTLRFTGDIYYRVFLVVYVYDEEVDRVNIGCELEQ